MAERGYGKAMHKDATLDQCQCPEEFEHDGKCPNRTRERKAYKCQPCSSGWHHPFSCQQYVSKGYLTLNTQCDRCGWDSSEHPITERQRELVIDAQWKRDGEGRLVNT
jgi:hypothetical protein